MSKYKQFFQVVDPSGKVRFETLYVHEAEDYASFVYKRGGGQICSIERKDIKN
jgi:hypothetical protein